MKAEIEAAAEAFTIAHRRRSEGRVELNEAEREWARVGEIYKELCKVASAAEDLLLNRLRTEATGSTADNFPSPTSDA